MPRRLDKQTYSYLETADGEGRILLANGGRLILAISNQIVTENKVARFKVNITANTQ